MAENSTRSPLSSISPTGDSHAFGLRDVQAVINLPSEVIGADVIAQQLLTQDQQVSGFYYPPGIWEGRVVFPSSLEEDPERIQEIISLVCPEETEEKKDEEGVFKEEGFCNEMGLINHYSDDSVFNRSLLEWFIDSDCENIWDLNRDNTGGFGFAGYEEGEEQEERIIDSSQIVIIEESSSDQGFIPFYERGTASSLYNEGGAEWSDEEGSLDAEGNTDDEDWYWECNESYQADLRELLQELPAGIDSKEAVSALKALYAKDHRSSKSPIILSSPSRVDRVDSLLPPEDSTEGVLEALLDYIEVLARESMTRAAAFACQIQIETLMAEGEGVYLPLQERTLPKKVLENVLFAPVFLRRWTGESVDNAFLFDWFTLFTTYGSTYGREILGGFVSALAVKLLARRLSGDLGEGASQDRTYRGVGMTIAPGCTLLFPFAGISPASEFSRGGHGAIIIESYLRCFNRIGGIGSLTYKGLKEPVVRSIVGEWAQIGWPQSQWEELIRNSLSEKISLPIAGVHPLIAALPYIEGVPNLSLVVIQWLCKHSKMSKDSLYVDMVKLFTEYIHQKAIIDDDLFLSIRFQLMMLPALSVDPNTPHMFCRVLSNLLSAPISHDPKKPWALPIFQGYCDIIRNLLRADQEEKNWIAVTLFYKLCHYKVFQGTGDKINDIVASIREIVGSRATTWKDKRLTIAIYGFLCAAENYPAINPLDISVWQAWFSQKYLETDDKTKQADALMGLAALSLLGPAKNALPLLKEICEVLSFDPRKWGASHPALVDLFCHAVQRILPFIEKKNIYSWCQFLKQEWVPEAYRQSFLEWVATHPFLEKKSKKVEEQLPVASLETELQRLHTEIADLLDKEQPNANANQPVSRHRLVQSRLRWDGAYSIWQNCRIFLPESKGKPPQQFVALSKKLAIHYLHRDFAGHETSLEQQAFERLVEIGAVLRGRVFHQMGVEEKTLFFYRLVTDIVKQQPHKAYKIWSWGRSLKNVSTGALPDITCALDIAKRLLEQGGPHEEALNDLWCAIHRSSHQFPAIGKEVLAFLQAAATRAGGEPVNPWIGRLREFCKDLKEKPEGVNDDQALLIWHAGHQAEAIIWLGDCFDKGWIGPIEAWAIVNSLLEECYQQKESDSCLILLEKFGALCQHTCDKDHTCDQLIKIIQSIAVKGSEKRVVGIVSQLMPLFIYGGNVSMWLEVISTYLHHRTEASLLMAIDLLTRHSNALILSDSCAYDDVVAASIATLCDRFGKENDQCIRTLINSRQLPHFHNQEVSAVAYAKLFSVVEQSFSISSKKSKTQKAQQQRMVAVAMQVWEQQPQLQAIPQFFVPYFSMLFKSGRNESEVVNGIEAIGDRIFGSAIEPFSEIWMTAIKSAIDRGEVRELWTLMRVPASSLPENDCSYELVRFMQSEKIRALPDATWLFSPLISDSNRVWVIAAWIKLSLCFNYKGVGADYSALLRIKSWWEDNQTEEWSEEEEFQTSYYVLLGQIASYCSLNKQVNEALSITKRAFSFSRDSLIKIEEGVLKGFFILSQALVKLAYSPEFCASKEEVYRLLVDEMFPAMFNEGVDGNFIDSTASYIESWMCEVHKKCEENYPLLADLSLDYFDKVLEIPGKIYSPKDLCTIASTVLAYVWRYRAAPCHRGRQERLRGVHERVIDKLRELAGSSGSGRFYQYWQAMTYGLGCYSFTILDSEAITTAVIGVQPLIVQLVSLFQTLDARIEGLDACFYILEQLLYLTRSTFEEVRGDSPYQVMGLAFSEVCKAIHIGSTDNGAMNKRILMLEERCRLHFGINKCVRSAMKFYVAAIDGCDIQLDHEHAVNIFQSCFNIQVQTRLIADMLSFVSLEHPKKRLKILEIMINKFPVNISILSNMIVPLFDRQESYKTFVHQVFNIFDSMLSLLKQGIHGRVSSVFFKDALMHVTNALCQINHHFGLISCRIINKDTMTRFLDLQNVIKGIYTK